MQLKMPTLAQTYAFGRHVVSYAAGAVTMAAAVHVINGDQSSSLLAAITQIYNGVTSIAGGIATIVSVSAGLYAAWSSSPLSQLLAVARSAAVKQIVVASPATADAVPSYKVVAK